MFNNICFFHNHVNGDCFFSRILVKQIIDANKSKNITFYYTAPRALISHCLDLGIPDKNFNITNVPHPECLFFIIDDFLFINVWIGITTDTNLSTENKICALCLKNVIPNYNKLIELLNNSFKMNIDLLDTNDNKSPYLPIDHNYYNGNFINNFISVNKKKYEKIVLISNNSPTTFITLNSITEKYLRPIVNRFPNYLFITFEDTILHFANLISIKNIYKQTGTQIDKNWGIMFSLLSKLSDKVILIPSGVSLTCFNNETIKNKFMMFFDYSVSGNPGKCPHCNNIKDKLCTDRLNWDITLIDINFQNVNLNTDIYNSVENFLKK